MTTVDRARAIEAEASALIATLPALPPERLDALIVEVRALAAAVDAPIARVAEVLAEVIALYREERAVLEGWAVVASAAHTLARAVASGGDAHALAAVRFELETLLPPRAPAAVRPQTPDVPLTSLVRRT